MIHQKLLAVQQALKAPKNQVNDFGHYNYRSCEDILEAVKPHLQTNQLVLRLTDEMKEVGGRVYVQATAELVDAETGEAVATKAFAREEEMKKGMDVSQVTGAASSYARKYALNGLFCIDDNKDSDATNKGDKQPESSGNKKHGKDTPAAPETQPAADIKVLQDEKGSYVVCANCGKRIRDKVKDGSVYTVQDYVAACMRVFGRPVCSTCWKKYEGQAT